MLTALRLGNFKAFGESQTIPIRPLTLIFGPNSGGKSSIIHGLLFAHEARWRHSFDIQHTQVGGTSVDLGGFPSYVHRHNPHAIVEWGIEGDASEVRLGIGRAEKAEVGQGRAPRVISVSISLGSEPLLRAVLSKDGKLRVDSLNCKNVRLGEKLKSEWLASLKCPDGTESGTEFWQSIREQCEGVQTEQLAAVLRQNWKSLKLSIESAHFFAEGEYSGPVVNLPSGWRPQNTSEYKRLSGQLGALFDRDRDLFLKSLEERREEAGAEVTRRDQSGSLRMGDTRPGSRGLSSEMRLRARIGGTVASGETALRVLEHIPEDCDEETARGLFYEIADPFFRVGSWLEQLIEEAVANVSELDRVRYLGPLRSFPNRLLTFSEQEDANWQAGGGSAWETLRDNPSVCKDVNEGLKRLGVPYKIVIREFREKKSGEVLKQVGLRDEKNGTLVTHRDVGIGVSQVLPVLVAALGTREQIHCIEQPEIHLHPALQAELGDVFIESALGKNKNTFLLETHSEHLILRILRRIRETTAGSLPKDCIPVRPEDVQVLFVEPGEKGAVVHDLPISPEGEFLINWPQGFFAERAKELF